MPREVGPLPPVLVPRTAGIFPHYVGNTELAPHLLGSFLTEQGPFPTAWGTPALPDGDDAVDGAGGEVGDEDLA